jgi:RNA polymerase sigma-70 factor (ECF subfamily)
MQEIVFENLFRAHYTFLYRTSYALTGRAEDAEDVVQTIFLRLIRREVPPDLEQNPRAYLYRAAVNLSLNSIRSRNRLLFTGDAGRLEVQDCPTAAQSIEEVHRRLCEAIVALSPDGLNILTLRYEHGWSDQEIAKLLGTSRGAIAARLHRLRARLRKVTCGGEGRIKRERMRS